MKQQYSILLVGDSRMAFPIAKALDQAGHKVFAGTSIYSNYLEWSRHITASFRHAPLEPGDDHALPIILEWLDANGTVDFIQPVSEAGLRFLTRHRERFAARAKLIMAPQDAIRAASDKPYMFELCDRIGIPLAPWRIVQTREEIITSAIEIGFPLIVKPATVDDLLFGRKALILESQDALEAAIPHWPDEHPNLLVQSYVRGPRHSAIFSAHKGKLLSAVEIRAARTHEYDGTGYTTYGITVEPTPAVRESTEKLVEALGYSSTGCTQFIVDPDRGAVTFMELNPRVSLGRAAECAGQNHSTLGLAVANDAAPTPPDDPWALPKRGSKYVWTLGEFYMLLRLIKHRRISITDAVSRFARMSWDALTCHHAIFDPLDPLPALGVYTNKILKPFRGPYPGRPPGPELTEGLAYAGNNDTDS